MKNFIYLLALVTALETRALASQTTLTIGLEYKRPLDAARPISSPWRSGAYQFTVSILPDGTFWIAVTPDKHFTSQSPVDGRFYFFDLVAGTKRLIDVEKIPKPGFVTQTPQKNLTIMKAAVLNSATNAHIFAAFHTQDETGPEGLNRVLFGELPTGKKRLEFYKLQVYKDLYIQNFYVKSEEVRNSFFDDPAELWKLPTTGESCREYSCGHHPKNPTGEELPFTPDPKNFL